MTPEEAARSFRIVQDTDPVVSLLTKYGKPEAAEEERRTKEAIDVRFFHVEPAKATFTEGVGSADARSIRNVLYQIGLHYPDTHLKKVGWQGLTLPYIAENGKPTEDHGSSYVWNDGRTRLEIAASGSIVNLFYTDVELERAVKAARVNVRFPGSQLK